VKDCDDLFFGQPVPVTSAHINAVDDTPSGSLQFFIRAVKTSFLDDLQHARRSARVVEIPSISKNDGPLCQIANQHSTPWFRGTVAGSRSPDRRLHHAARGSTVSIKLSVISECAAEILHAGWREGCGSQCPQPVERWSMKSICRTAPRDRIQLEDQPVSCSGRRTAAPPRIVAERDHVIVSVTTQHADTPQCTDPAHDRG